METKNINSAAKILFDLKLNAKSIINLKKNFSPKNIQEAYLIQEELHNNYLLLNDNICIGKKVGCTNKEAQIQIGVSEPFYGNLYSRFSSTNNCTIYSKNFSEPYIEPEISFILRKDVNISKAPFSLKQANELFEGLICSIEIVDFRFKKPINKIGIENLIATNGASDFWIKGKKIFRLDEINLFDHPIKLIIDDIEIEEGNLNNVLGNPLNSALWVINKLAENNKAMLKGQYISTGSCTKAAKLLPNKKVKANFINLEIIEFEYI